MLRVGVNQMQKLANMLNQTSNDSQANFGV
jgi:hypothetical protein